MWKHVAKKLPPALQLVVSHLEEAEECKFQEFESYRIGTLLLQFAAAKNSTENSMQQFKHFSKQSKS